MKDELAKVLQFFEDKPGFLKTSKHDVANKLNVSVHDIEEAKRIIREQSEPVETSLDDFAKERGFNPENAHIIWHKGKDFSVKLNQPKVDIDEEKLYDFLNQYSFSPVVKDKSYPKEKALGLINIFDAHIDKLSINGKGGLDEIKSNLDDLFDVFNNLLSDVLLDNPHTIIFPIGNDFFNINNTMPETKAGTYQPTTSHWQDVFHLGVEFYRKCIDSILLYTNIHVVVIPGNHDTDKTFYLSQVIKAIYESHSLNNVTNNVTIDTIKQHYKFVSYDDILLGFDHGKVAMKRINKLSSIMALSVPELWSKAKRRIWFNGDKHHKEDYKILKNLETEGVDIRFLRASTDADEWHVNEMWTGAKKSISATVFLNDKEVNYEVFF